MWVAYMHLYSFDIRVISVLGDLHLFGQVCFWLTGLVIFGRCVLSLPLNLFHFELWSPPA